MNKHKIIVDSKAITHFIPGTIDLGPAVKALKLYGAPPIYVIGRSPPPLVKLFSPTIYVFLLTNQIADNTTRLGIRCFMMDSELDMEFIAIGYIIINWPTMINNTYNLEIQVQKLLRNRS